MQQVADTFASQDGLATIAQLNELGVGPGFVRQRVESGEWQRFDERVVGMTGAPVTWRRHVRAALLSAGPDAAAVSDETVGRMHGFDGFSTASELHITAFTRRHVTSLPGVVVHRSKLLTPDLCVTIDDMACVSRPIALVQIAGTHGRDAAAKALDGMLRDRNSPAWIRQTVEAWRRPGVKGARTVLELLDERVDKRLPRSWFQRLAKRSLAAHGHVLVDEHPVDDRDGRRLAELDLAIPHLQIGVECQSWQWHSTPAAATPMLFANAGSGCSDGRWSRCGGAT